MVNDFGKAIAAFVTVLETRQIAQPKKLNTTNINVNSWLVQIGKGQHHIAKKAYH